MKSDDINHRQSDHMMLLRPFNYGTLDKRQAFNVFKVKKKE